MPLKYMYAYFGAFSTAHNEISIFGMRPNIGNKHAYTRYMCKSLIYSVMWLYMGSDRDFLDFLKLSHDIFPELGTFPALGSPGGKPFYLGRPWEALGRRVCLLSARVRDPR